MLPEKKKEKTFSFYSLKRVCILLVMILTVNHVHFIQKDDSHTRQTFDIFLVMCHKALLTAILNFLVPRAYNILLYL